MAETYSSIVAGCQMLLLDADGTLYSPSLLLRAVNLALEEVRLDLANAGATDLRKEQSVTLPALTLELGVSTTPALNADFSAPIELHERPSGSTQPAEWREVRLVDDLDLTVDPGESLGVYVYQDGKLKFRGATSARELKLDYVADIPDFAGATEPLPVKMILAPLVFLTCAILTIAEAPDRADRFRRLGERALSKVKALGNKRKQMEVALRAARRYRVGAPRFRPLIQ